MTGDTRVILCTDDKTRESVVGLPVLHAGAAAPISTTRSDDAGGLKRRPNPATRVVHDCVLRVVGFTMVHEELLEACPKITNATALDTWNVGNFVDSVTQFLWEERRLYESHTGEPLVKAMLVRIDSKSGTVLEVLQ